MPSTEPGRVVALAGRRIDPPGAYPPRFPLALVRPVRERLRAALRERPTRALVCSAACGADLLALAVAEELGIPVHVVLPVGIARFRNSSVTDRPGEWGALYDRVIARAEERGSLVLLGGLTEGVDAYRAANVAILDEAEELAAAGGVAVTAIVVRDGGVREGADLTADFAEAARRRGYPVVEVRTMVSEDPSEVIG